MGTISACCLVVALFTSFFAVFCITRAMCHIHSVKAKNESDASWPSLLRAALKNIQRSITAKFFPDSSSSTKRVLRLPFINQLQKRAYYRDFSKNLPEALRLLSMVVESGGTLVKAFDYASRNCDEPLASELKQAVWDMKAGQSFEQALEALRQRTQSPQFAYLLVAMKIQHKSGASITEVLDVVAATLRQRAQMEEELITKTAQGRFSARVVAVVPVVLFVVLNIISPAYFAAFFESPLGVAIFSLAICLEFLGIIFVRKSLRVDLSGKAWGSR